MPPTNCEEGGRRLDLRCRVDPLTMQVIEKMYPGSGALGRKIDILAKEFLRLKTPAGPKKEGQWTKWKDIEEFLRQPGVEEWPSRRVARALGYGKTAVNCVRNRMNGKTEVNYPR